MARYYEPLDITNLCNVGTDFVEDSAEPPIGDQTFHGLPFQVGAAQPDPRCCLIGFSGRGDASESVTIPVGTMARHVIFAHALLESKLMEGESLGHVAAHRGPTPVTPRVAWWSFLTSQFPMVNQPC